jgi:hypothetical protein
MTASIASLTSSVVALQSFSGNVNIRFDNLQTYTTSVETRMLSLTTITGSLITSSSNNTISIVNLNNETASLETRATALTNLTGSLITTASNNVVAIVNHNTFSSSILTQLNTIGTETASLETRAETLRLYTASLNNFTASMTASYLALSASVAYSNGGVDFNAIFNQIAIVTGSLFNSSSNAATRLTTIESELFTLATYTGSVNTRFTTLQTLTASFSTSVNSLNAATSSYETNGRGIISGSSQIVPLLPVGVISGSSQILGNSTIHSGSIGNYQFNSIGVGSTVAASGVDGEIRAKADITAYYSSDERLKENINVIPNALLKVESISGNIYDWKKGFENIHSHTGRDIGVIAQEIEKVLPEIVIDRETGYKAVQYEKIIPLLIEAIKELSVKVKELENK